MIRIVDKLAISLIIDCFKISFFVIYLEGNCINRIKFMFNFVIWKIIIYLIYSFIIFFIGKVLFKNENKIKILFGLRKLGDFVIKRIIVKEILNGVF